MTGPFFDWLGLDDLHKETLYTGTIHHIRHYTACVGKMPTEGWKDGMQNPYFKSSGWWFQPLSKI